MKKYTKNDTQRIIRTLNDAAECVVCPVELSCSLCDEVRLLPRTRFQAQLARHNACGEARIWVGNKTAREAWEQCTRIEWMDWLLCNICGMIDLYFHAHAETPDSIRRAFPFEKVQRLCAEAYEVG